MARFVRYAQYAQPGQPTPGSKSMLQFCPSTEAPRSAGPKYYGNCVTRDAGSRLAST